MLLTPTEVRPRPLRSGERGVVDEPVLHDSQVQSWRANGFAFVDGLFSPELIDTLRTEATARFAAPGTSEAAEVSDFGNALTFPADLPAFNEVTLHPRLLTAIGQLLGRPVADLRLTQSDLWPKYGRTERTGGVYDNQDQRIHIDYPNHTLVHPAPWDRPEVVELILYLSDHRHCGGSTAVVPRTGPDDPAYRWPIVDSPGIGDLDWVNDRSSAERYLAERRPDIADWRRQLYERERLVAFQPGSVLFYRHDTWHRGTPLVPGGFRLAHNMTYRRADCEWINTLHRGWSWKMYRKDKLMERLIAGLQVDQRTVLGFPEPGSTYWSAETLDGVEARYGPLGMDMTPYRRAVVPSDDVGPASGPASGPVDGSV
ncbi:MAG: phytanoyl-CoA dioxygenase family protein [Acidimicrobiales bacterium]